MHSLALGSLLGLVLSAGCGVARRSDASSAGCEQNVCEPKVLHESAFAGAGDDDYLYFVTEPSTEILDSELWRVGKEPGAEKELVGYLPPAEPASTSFLLDEDIYFVSEHDLNSRIHRLYLGENAIELIAEELWSPSALASNSTHVFWGVRGAVMSYDKSTRELSTFDLSAINGSSELTDVLYVDEEIMLFQSDYETYRLELGADASQAQRLTDRGDGVGVSGEHYYFRTSEAAQDRIHRVPLQGGEPELVLESDFIGTPALRANGELLWFSYHDGYRELWTRSPEGETSLVKLAGEAEGSRIWIDTDPDSVAWISASWNEGGFLYHLDPAK